MTRESSYRETIEEEYHDELHKKGVIIKGHLDAGERSYYKFFNNLIGNVSGLIILEIGCGQGWNAMKLAKDGATVYGIDISGEVIKSANREAEKQGLADNALFRKMSAEDLRFDGLMFDLVIGSAILHHTNINLSIKNVYKVLKSGGRAVFIEPLNQNIVLKIWRKLTPWRRSPTEKALRKDDLNSIRSIFSSANFYYFGFLSIISAGLLIYFNKIKLIWRLNEITEKMDSWILRFFPNIGPYFAVTVIELKK